jgi:hypothetical protein
MMKTAEPGMGDKLRRGRRPVFDRSPVGSVFLKRIMSPILMMVGYVFVNKPTQMVFVQGNDVIEKFSATASYSSLGESVLPGRLNARPLGF